MGNLLTGVRLLLVLPAAIASARPEFVSPLVLLALALAVIPGRVDAQTDYQAAEVAAMRRNAEAGEWYSAYQLDLYYDEGWKPREECSPCPW